MLAASEMRCTLIGVGAMNSPRFAPAGLLLEYKQARVVFDGGPGAEPEYPPHAWLVTDERAELRTELRKLGALQGVTPAATEFVWQDLRIEPLPVAHTSHPTYGYRIVGDQATAVWAPEFWEFPTWAEGADLMFADAAGWNRPIRFARGVGGHASVYQVSDGAVRYRIQRLVFAHIGRPRFGPSMPDCRHR
jgi:hypothetical protein